jgi:hypothetical protein
MSRFLWSHWLASWPALIIYAAVAGVHLAGLRRLLSGGDPADPAASRRATIREAAVFQGGLLLALLVIVSPLGYWSGIYLWVRALGDLTLAFVAPGLIVLGAPWPALARGLGRPAPGASDAPGPRPWWLRWPVATVVAFNVIWLGGHLTVAFDRVPVSRLAAGAEYVLYLGGGILFWLQLIGSRPGGAADRHRGRGHRPGHGADLRRERGLPGLRQPMASRDDRPRRSAAVRRDPVDGHPAPRDRRRGRRAQPVAQRRGFSRALGRLRPSAGPARPGRTSSGLAVPSQIPMTVISPRQRIRSR